MVREESEGWTDRKPDASRTDARGESLAIPPGVECTLNSRGCFVRMRLYDAPSQYRPRQTCAEELVGEELGRTSTVYHNARLRLEAHGFGLLWLGAHGSS